MESEISAPPRQQKTVNERCYCLCTLRPVLRCVRWKSSLCVICLYAATNLLVSEVLDEVLLHTIPMVLGGDFNTDLKSTEGTEFLEFLRDTWKLELISDPAIWTTRGDTCTHTDTCDMYTSSLTYTWSGTFITRWKLYLHFLFLLCLLLQMSHSKDVG